MFARIWLLSLLVLFVLAGCDGPDAAPPAGGARNAGGGATVASLSPAATDILLGMGRGDRLVAVSDHDADPRVADLPRVGAYDRFDWERLAEVRPDAVVVQIGEANLPPGSQDRAAAVGAEFVNVEIARLADIEAAIGTLADVVGTDGGAATARFRRELGPTPDDPADPADPPRVLVLLDAGLTFAAGRGQLPR